MNHAAANATHFPNDPVWQKHCAGMARRLEWEAHMINPHTELLAASKDFLKALKVSSSMNMDAFEQQLRLERAILSIELINEADASVNDMAERT